MKQHYPAADRNKQVILDALRPLLPPRGTVLEIASGTGQHMAFFAAALPKLRFQPSDYDPELRASVDAYCAELPNVAPSVALDVTRDPFPAADAIFCANMIHIAPWSAAEGLFAGVGEALASGGLFALYGPFRFSGSFTAESNAAFDARLRSRDPAWGVRDVDDLDALAEAAGLSREQTIAMPANNHILAFRAGG